MAVDTLTSKADEVLLKNGDRISGTILSKSGSVLEMKTDYSDKVVIKWDAVETLNSNQPMTNILKDRQELTGLAGKAENVAMPINSNGVYNSQPIPLAEVTDINKKFFSSSANFGGGLSGGNTERQNHHADANIIVQGHDDRVTLGGQYNYADSAVVNPNTNQNGKPMPMVCLLMTVFKTSNCALRLVSVPVISITNRMTSIYRLKPALTM